MPLAALAGSLIGAVATLSVAMLRFGLGKVSNNPGHSITKRDLDDAVSSITQAVGEAATAVKGEVAGVRGEVSAVRGQLSGYGETMGRIEGKLHSHGNPK